MSTDTEWPPVSFEERPWQAPVQYGNQKYVTRRHNVPYRAALVPRIAEIDLKKVHGIPEVVYSALIQIGDFERVWRRHRAGAAVEAVLARLEAAHSAQLESLNTTGTRPDLMTSLTEPLPPPAVAVWRTEQVWLGGGNIGPHDAHYVPPHPDNVPAAMADLQLFLRHRDRFNTFTRAAIALAQYEAIRPLSEGNGLAARRTFQSALLVRGTVPVSIGLLRDPRGYRNALAAYRNGDVARIMATMADATFVATTTTKQLILDIESIFSSWRWRMSEVRSDSVIWRILPSLAGQPIVDVASVARDFGVSTMSAQRAIRKLAFSRILREFTGGKRSRKWVADQIVACFEAFIARSSAE